MILLTIVVFVISVLEIKAMIKRKQKKEIIVFCIITALSLLLGYFYLTNPYQESLTQHVLSLFGKEI